MQKLILLLLLTLPIGLMAQEYKLSAQSSTYSHFDDGTEIESERYLKLPFQLKADTLYDSLYIKTSGIAKDRFLASDLEMNFCYAISGDSEISYKVEGNEGSRIVKIQFERIKFFTDSTRNDSTEGQIWLYEADNTLEMHYGATVVNNTRTYGINFVTNEYDLGFLCGLSVGLNNYYLKGNPSSPGIQGDFEFTTLTGNPAEGQVYKFELQPNSIRNELPFGLKVYPNPSNGILNLEKASDIDSEPAQLTIMTLDGQTVYNAQVNGQLNVQTFDLKNLPAGIYLVQVGSGANLGHTRIIIQ